MFEFAVSARSTAAIDDVWAVLVDSIHWPDWTALPTPTMERWGDPYPYGIGAVRRFAWGPVRAREQVVLWEPPHRYGYAVIGGMPIRGYQAFVTLAGSGNGTAITWRGMFQRSTWPGMSRPLCWFTKTMLQRYVRNLARHAEVRPLAR
jgi:hypothetical protein